MNAAVPPRTDLRLTLSAAADLLKGELRGTDNLFDAVGTDTRTLPAGALFVALEGPRFDGHDYLAAARERGACAALVSRPVSDPLTQVLVSDTRLALGRLAAWRRRQVAIPVAAITGSSGKTTVKEMLAAILRSSGPILATRGNLNNDIGLPLTLLGLQPEHRFAVVELGANHPGEIAYTTAIARPDVALIVNAGPAHLEGFGDLDGVARAKGEIYQGLGPDGTGIMNADDPYADLWRGLLGRRQVLRFGLDHPADVTAVEVTEGRGGQCFRLISPWGGAQVTLPLSGRHNLMNALAAAAAALALGIAPAEVAAGLAEVRAIRGRLQELEGRSGSSLIDDTYNANPGSVRAAIAVLAARAGERVLVLGDMAELGPTAEALHAEVGQAAREAGIHWLFATGPLSRAAVAGFGSGARHFDDHRALIDALGAELHEGMTVLVKGSRSMGMERVVDALRAAGEG